MDDNPRNINGLVMGQVVENKDPAGLDRVRVTVPGLTNLSPWAFPLFRMFGVQNGIHWVPEVQSNVAVFYNQAHPDFPFYVPGPFGAPGGTPDMPGVVPSGDTDQFVLQWRNFYIQINGKQGSEVMVVKDITSGTSLSLTRQTGNFERTVTGPTGTEKATIKGDLDVEVQTGNETHTVDLGNRTTTIAVGNDTKTVGGNDAETIGGSKTKTVAGSETDTITGAKTETVALASTETIGLAKALTAGLAIAITAGAAVTITAGGAVSVLGAGVSVQSTAGSANISAGPQLNTLLGGIISNIVGAVVQTVVGAWELTSTTASILSAVVNLGLGPWKTLLTSQYHTDMVYPHTHIETGTPGAYTSTPYVPLPPLVGPQPIPATPPAGDATVNTLAS